MDGGKRTKSGGVEDEAGLCGQAVAETADRLDEVGGPAVPEYNVVAGKYAKSLCQLYGRALSQAVQILSE